MHPSIPSSSLGVLARVQRGFRHRLGNLVAQAAPSDLLLMRTAPMTQVTCAAVVEVLCECLCVCRNNAVTTPQLR